jgi:hypothetical protein
MLWMANTRATSRPATASPAATSMCSSRSRYPSLSDRHWTRYRPNCHSGAAPDAGLNLSDADTSYANLVGVSTTQLGGAGIRVIAGDPGNSYLIQKLENAAGIEGVRMPLGGAALNQTDIDFIRQWITGGALR